MGHQLLAAMWAPFDPSIRFWIPSESQTPFFIPKKNQVSAPLTMACFTVKGVKTLGPASQNENIATNFDPDCFLIVLCTE